jgi:S-DNA-T family DNA segregation ATPase FtsK/SpoIIIE
LRFVYRRADADYDLELRVGRPDATVGDLAAALGARAGLLVDGREVRPDTSLGESGLLNGSRLAPAGSAAPVPAGAALADCGTKPIGVLRIVGGLEAGRSVPLSVGRVVLGRGHEADVHVECADVSRAHCVVEVAEDGAVSIADLGSVNGTDVNGRRISSPAQLGPDDLVSLAGKVFLRVLSTDQLGPVHHVNPVREARPGGTLPFNRAPRLAEPAGPPPVELPRAPRGAGKTPFSVSMLLGPLLLAAAMVVVMRDLTYAFIAALTPVVFLGEFAEERTRGRFSLRRGRREYAARLQEAFTQLAARQARELQQRHAAFPDPAEVLFRAEAPGLRLWERRSGAADFLRVSVGLADQLWASPVEQRERDPEPDPALAVVLAATAFLPQVPVAVELAAGGVLGLEGDRGAMLAVARSLLCQAVVASGPADVTVAVFADEGRIAEWDWTKWLPHGADVRSGSARYVAAGPEQSEALARSLLMTAGRTSLGADTAARQPVVLVIVDGVSLLEGRPCPLRELLSGTSVPCGGIVITDRLPALCTATLTANTDGVGSLRRVTTGEELNGILLSGTARGTAAELARALARFEDPELRVDGAGLPDSINLLPLLDLPEPSGPAIARRWRDRAGPVRDRPGRRRPARADRRDHRLGQERTAQDPDREHGRRHRPGAPDLRAGGLQGWRRAGRVRPAATCRRARDRPR